MLIQNDPPLHLTYCLNIHPGEGWTDVRRAVAEKALRVKEALARDRPFGLGLRIGAEAVADARRDAAAFRTWLDEHGLYVFTINGFPYGRFHGARVKERVYAPDWREPARVRYTIDLAGLLAALLPEGVEGSISTVPLSWKGWASSREARTEFAGRLAEVVAALLRIRERTGRTIHLGLEPEPGCRLERTGEVREFFRDSLFQEGVAAMRAIVGGTAAACEAALRAHVGVCVDTCHLAVQGERPDEALALLRGDGVRVSKIQLSAALRAPNTAAGRAALAPFAEPVYFHQAAALAGGTRAAQWDDLPDALDALPGRDAGEEVRVHFHVPLFWEGTGVLRSTAGELGESFWIALRGGASAHLEVETYTFDVLPPDLRTADVVDSIVRELRWARERICRSPRSGPL